MGGKACAEVLQKVKTANFVTEGKHWKGVSADGKGFVQAGAALWFNVAFCMPKFQALGIQEFHG